MKTSMAPFWFAFLAPVAAAAAAAPPCTKLPKTAVPAVRKAANDADWSRWDPKLAGALKALWQRSVLAVGKDGAHAASGTKSSLRRPQAEGPFEASAWDLGDATFVAFRVKVVPAAETDNAATRVERFAGLWADGKLTRLDDRCFGLMEPAYVDVAARTTYGKPVEGDCLTVSCPLPTAKR